MENEHQVLLRLEKKNLFHFLFPLILIFLSITHANAAGPVAKRFQINWNLEKINETLTQSQSIQKIITFSINNSFQYPFQYHVELSPTRKLEPYVSISPETFENVEPNQEHAAQVTITIPDDAEEKNYKGSIRLFIKMQWMERVHPNWKGWKAPSKLKTLIQVTSDPADLTIKNENTYPTRIARGSDGNFYVTDAMAGSVFIYNADLQLVGELKGLEKPLGIAVDPNGNIYVGNNGRDNVEVYRADGVYKTTIDDMNIIMPTDIILDLKGNIYVVDSKADSIKVYNAEGQWLREIGGPGDSDGNLKFPVAAAIAHTAYDQDDSGLIYVADQGHAKIQVYDLSGNFITSFGEKVAAFSSDWEGKFSKIQSLAFDSQNQLLILDCYLNKMQILDPDPDLLPDVDRFIDAYGEKGTDPGQLNVPMDFLITDSDKIIVTNAGNNRVENILITP